MSERKTILVVDDDQGIRESLSAFLTRTGFNVLVGIDGEQGLKLCASRSPDLLVLDVLMPRMDGRETVRRMRAAGDWTPVILLTQVGEASERAMALDEGADDYINKPFEAHELVARIRAVLRRADSGKPSLAASWVLSCRDLELDRRTRRLTLKGEEVLLTPKALVLLEYLMTHPDEIISRDRALDAVWGWEQLGATRAVDARIAELRRVLGDQAGEPKFIETVPGIGYRFVGLVERGG